LKRYRSMTSDIAISKARRIFFLGVNTGFVVNGLPDQRYLNFYASRSSPDLHCAIVGNVVIPNGYGTNSNTPILTKEHVWADLAREIAARGTLPGIQLSTTWRGYQGLRKFVNTSPTDMITEARRLIATIESVDVASLLSSFKDASMIAIEQGFRHIQFHCAHGYLLSLLIDERFYNDAARVRDRLSEISECLRTLHIETSIRISLKTGADMIDQSGSIIFQDSVASLPFDFVDLSSGFYNIDKLLIYPTRPDMLKSRSLESLDAASRHPNRNFILSGHALQHDWALMPQNLHLGICRDLIANPNVLREPNNGCINCNKCHYFSRGKSHLTCGQWLT
jgi:NADH:flavin oxidoreductase / NADH oxidase family